MTSMGLVRMFKGDFTEKRAEKFQPVSMGGREEGQECADPGTRTPIGTSENYLKIVGIKYVNH